MPIICWICKKNIANSKEHKFKQDILRERAFNSSNQNDKPYLINLNNSRSGLVQGSNSKKVKYDNIICSVCNNQYSQLWDKAYSEFINFYIRNRCVAYVDFKQIFGRDYIDKFMNLYKYFVKSLGCALVSGGLDLSVKFPNPLRNFDLKNFRITICRCDSANIFLKLLEKKLLSKRSLIADNILGKGDLQITYSKSHFKTTGFRLATSAVWWESIGDLRIWYWYNREPIAKFGIPLSDPNEIYPIKETNLTYNEIKQQDDLLHNMLIYCAI